MEKTHLLERLPDNLQNSDAIDNIKTLCGLPITTPKHRLREISFNKYDTTCKKCNRIFKIRVEKADKLKTEKNNG